MKNLKSNARVESVSAAELCLIEGGVTYGGCILELPNGEYVEEPTDWVQVIKGYRDQVGHRPF